MDAVPVGRRVGGVVVTYQPCLTRLREVLEAVACQVEHVVIVDNASAEREKIEVLVSGLPNAELRAFSKNLGVGAALNAGVAVHLAAARDWVLTLDQDTVVHKGSVGRLFDELDLLDDEIRKSCGVLGMSRGVARAQGWRRRWIAGANLIGERGGFSERRSVITSGNLVRADVFRDVQYNEDFFIDQIDTLFCADVRKLGRRVLELREPTMDHRLGQTIDTKRGPRAYEGGIRLYYIARNGLSVVLRTDLPLRVFVRDILGLSRVYVRVNGLRSVAACTSMVLAGMRDGALKRFGPRSAADFSWVPHDDVR